MVQAGPNVILFDIDGTLISAHGAGRRAFERAVGDFLGSEIRLEFSFAGGTDRGIAREALTSLGEVPAEEAIDGILAMYVEYLEVALRASTEFTVFSGVVELLDQLYKRRDIALGLGTGNVEVGARIKLSRGGLNDYFFFGGFGCDAEDRAELIRTGATRGATRLGVALEECRVLIIGDTPRDVAAARAIGADSLAVATGFPSQAELKACNPTYCVADLRDGLVRELLLGM